MALDVPSNAFFTAHNLKVSSCLHLPLLLSTPLPLSLLPSEGCTSVTAPRALGLPAVCLLATAASYSAITLHLRYGFNVRHREEVSMD